MHTAHGLGSIYTPKAFDLLHTLSTKRYAYLVPFGYGLLPTDSPAEDDEAYDSSTFVLAIPCYT